MSYKNLHCCINKMTSLDIYCVASFIFFQDYHFDLSCELDLSQFPFDEQTCFIKIILPDGIRDLVFLRAMEVQFIQIFSHYKIYTISCPGLKVLLVQQVKYLGPKSLLHFHVVNYTIYNTDTWSVSVGISFYRLVLLH